MLPPMKDTHQHDVAVEALLREFWERPLPALTEERRRELVKIAQSDAETARNQIRQIRRDGNEEFKKLEKDKEISEDQMHDGQESVQKLTDAYVEKINNILKAKEAEILEV